MHKKRNIKQPFIAIPVKPTAFLSFLFFLLIITAIKPTHSIAHCSQELKENLGSGKNKTNSATEHCFSIANFSTGNLYEEYIIPLGFLNLTLSYNSRDSYTGPLGTSWTHRYNTNLSNINAASLVLTQQDGRRVRYQSTDGITYLPEEKFGETSTISMNPDNTFTLAETNGIIKNFAIDGKLAAITDRNGNITTLTYTGQDLTTITGPYGRVVTLTYASGKITTITDPLGRQHSITYTGSLLTSIANPASETTRYTYNINQTFESIEDPSGGITAYTYDPQGRLLSSQDPLGISKSIQYIDQEYKAIITDRNGNTTEYIYDKSLNVKKQKKDSLGNITTYTYDTRGNLLITTYPDSLTESYTYDINNNLLTNTDRGGNTTTYTYEPNYNQVASIQDPLGNTATFGYDPNGNLTAITDQLNNITTYTYDSRGRVTTITNPIGSSVTTITYDSYGNPSTITDGLGNMTTLTSDILGNPLTVTNANGNPTTYTYDNLNRLTSSIDALSQTTGFTYGPTCQSCGGGKLTSITDANNNTTTFQYDIKGRQTTKTNPMGNTTTYTYDGNGNIASRTDRNGNTINYAYDGRNRLISKNYPDGTQTAFTYDTLGRIITAVHDTISYTIAYDPNGRPINITDSNGKTITYQYNTAGRRTQMTTPDGAAVQYSYDAGNRLTQILPTGSNPFIFTYDQNNRRTTLAYPNGMTAAYAYDTISRLAGITHKTSAAMTINDIAYTHDPTGSRFTRKDPDKEFTYSYDTTNRLLKSLPAITNPNGNIDAVKEETFTYDPVGNRLTGPKGNKAYTYDNANKLMSYRKRQYQYDNNGSLTKKIRNLADGTIKTWSYTYDYENRLIKAEKDSDGTVIKTVTFKYDPFGRRVGKKIERTKNGIPVTKEYTYVYDNEDVILETFTKVKNGNTTTKITKYIHGPGIDEPLEMEKDGIKYYYHADGLGSITQLTNANQAVIESYTYDVFGKQTRYGDTVKNRYTFTGREWDRETGLYYYRARYYDANIGRFITEDPIGFAGGVNFYTYVGNNPVNFTDPWGLWYIDIGVSGSATGKLGPGGTIGLQIGPSGLFFYYGIGLGIGAGASATINTGDPCEGVSVAGTARGGYPVGGFPVGAQGSVGISQNGGVSARGGLGFGLGLGVSVTATQTVPLLRW